MATARDFVAYAMRRIGIIGVDDAPTSAEMDIGLEALNDMLQAWSNDGMNLEESLPFEAANVIASDEKYHRGVKLSLVEEIASIYGAAVSVEIARAADHERRRIAASLLTIEDMTFEAPLDRDWLVEE